MEDDRYRPAPNGAAVEGASTGPNRAAAPRPAAVKGGQGPTPPTYPTIERRKGDRRCANATQTGAWRVIALAAGPGLWINFCAKEVLVNGARAFLTPKEFELLCLLASQPGRVFSDDEIIARVWGSRSSATTAHVAQYAHRLRKKLGDDTAHPACLVNVKRFGYKLNCSTSPSEQSKPEPDARGTAE